MKIKYYLRSWSPKLLVLTLILAICIITVAASFVTKGTEPTDDTTDSNKLDTVLQTEESTPQIIHPEVIKVIPTATPMVPKIEEPTEDPYNGFTHEDYILLATTIYCEADPKGYLEEAIAIGWVIRNRLEDTDTWGDSSFLEVISRKNPIQFSVYSTDPNSKFCKIYSSIEEMDDVLANNAKKAAMVVLSGEQRIPEDVQFFCADYYYETVKKSNGNWGTHPLYDAIGGTVFFYKK